MAGFAKHLRTHPTRATGSILRPLLLALGGFGATMFAFAAGGGGLFR